MSKYTDLHTTLGEEEETLKFVRTAATAFREDPDMISYTTGPIEPGCLFALRWGLDNDCIMIFKVGTEFNPVVFDQVV